MTAEMAPGTPGAAPTYTGWWFDLFRNREADGLSPAGFVASYFTGEQISYLGATAPRLGVFVIDRAGTPRLAVGPVARGYGHLDEVAHRLDDAAGAALPEAGRVAPWEASYTIAAPAEPSLELAWQRGEALTIATRTAIKVVLQPYDHHRVALATVTRAVGPGTTKIKLPQGAKVEGVHLHVGGYEPDASAEP
jgi:hypothetical protein